MPDPAIAQTKTLSTSCIVDVETGGVKPEHPTIQIAAVIFDDATREIVDEIEVKLKFDENACDPKALKMNHYNADVWHDEAVGLLTARAVLHKFFVKHRSYELISKKTGDPYKIVRLIAHNASFDIARLRALWGDDFMPFCWWFPLDTLQLALWHFSTMKTSSRPENFQLGTLCDFFGIDTSDAHDALTDCRLTLALLKRLRPLGLGSV